MGPPATIDSVPFDSGSYIGRTILFVRGIGFEGEASSFQSVTSQQDTFWQVLLARIFIFHFVAYRPTDDNDDDLTIL